MFDVVKVQMARQPKMQLAEYETIKVIGEGTYGKCYLARHSPSQEMCVLKQISISGLSPEDVDKAEHEATILEALDHPNIVKFIKSFREDDQLNIVMEYSDGGDLSRKIKDAKNNALPEAQILNWFTQICLAIKHVHDRKVLHRDLKASNVFLMKDGTVKLGDFGISRHFDLTLDKTRSVVGTPYYMAPEICDNQDYSFKADIWSIGIILLQLCLLKPPFDANSLAGLALKISKGQYQPVPKIYSKELGKLVSEILQVDPNLRPGIHKILKFPIIKSRIDFLLPRQVRDKEFSHTTLHSLNVFEARQHFADYGNEVGEESEINQITAISPKHSSSTPSHLRNLDLPMQYKNNFVKESKKEDKKKKKEPELKRKEGSEPNLTPKAHAKIENEKRLVRNSSTNQIVKKIEKRDSAFKKKNKQNVEICNHLEEVFQVRNQVVQLRSQLSHRNQDKICEDQNSYSEQQTPLQTLRFFILGKQQPIEEDYAICKANQGLCPLSVPNSGLLSLLYAFEKGMT